MLCFYYNLHYLNKDFDDGKKLNALSKYIFFGKCDLWIAAKMSDLSFKRKLQNVL